MKYLVIENKKCDEFVHEFDSREEAIKYAKDDFEHMHKLDQKSCRQYYVLESINPDEDSENHYDGNIILSLK